MLLRSRGRVSRWGRSRPVRAAVRRGIGEDGDGFSIAKGED